MSGYQFLVQRRGVLFANRSLLDCLRSCSQCPRGLSLRRRPKLYLLPLCSSLIGSSHVFNFFIGDWVIGILILSWMKVLASLQISTSIIPLTGQLRMHLLEKRNFLFLSASASSSFIWSAFFSVVSFFYLFHLIRQCFLEVHECHQYFHQLI